MNDGFLALTLNEPITKFPCAFLLGKSHSCSKSTEKLTMVLEISQSVGPLKVAAHVFTTIGVVVIRC